MFITIRDNIRVILCLFVSKFLMIFDFFLVVLLTMRKNLTLGKKVLSIRKINYKMLLKEYNHAHKCRNVIWSYCIFYANLALF